HSTHSTRRKPMTLIKQFLAARLCGVPLIAVTTPDQHATTIAVCKAVADLHDAEADSPRVPVIRWDFCQGFQQVNTVGEAALKVMLDGKDPRIFTRKPVDSLVAAQNLPPETIVIFHNAQRYLDNAAVAQAVANLREAFKSSSRTLVLLAPSITLPPELANDVLVL